ncbi:hypothetical protein L1987_33693 [Smallanthus sonchifolius]|uniref:Uncharacterized protein n=1 Tax=Smallanthus sonchifolius TaxID=185202 RepID=A0ACB9HSK3_9ASTR|nr:hypothetical protein L1987_33693 [Smallanthus sonchifolius]
MEKQKIVAKVNMNGDKKTRKALQIAVSISGVESASFVGSDKDQIAVIGAGIDAVELASLLRRKVGFTEIVSIGPVEVKIKTRSEYRMASWIGLLYLMLMGDEINPMNDEDRDSKEGVCVKDAVGLNSKINPMNPTAEQIERYPVKDMLSATNNFSRENLIMEGALGKVYKGHLLLRDKKLVVQRKPLITNDGVQEELDEEHSIAPTSSNSLEIPLSKIRRATNGFNKKCLVGSGGIAGGTRGTL